MNWWQQPRRVNIVVDNDSWVIPYAEELVRLINTGSDKGVFISNYADMKEAEISVYLGCVKLTPLETLATAKKNLVAHASDLPKGRGFSPLTYMILEGKNDIPLCLLEMAEGADSGPVIYKEWIRYQGHELLDELRQKLGQAQIDIVLKYLAAKEIPQATPQKGEPSYYKRRRLEDSRIELMDEQFNLLRIADNDKYPVYFEKNGHKYVLRVEKDENR